MLPFANQAFQNIIIKYSFHIRRILKVKKLICHYFGEVEMRKTLLYFVLIFIAPGWVQLSSYQDSSPQVTYQVDLINPEDDLFHVTVLTENLSIENNIYNFAATAPGAYGNLDFGRFVQSFKAFDKEGNELKTEKLSTNRWQIENSERLSRVVYKIEDSFDADIQDHTISPMGGTGIQDDFIVFNTFGVLGYFEGLQSIPVKLKIEYRSDWISGTAMDIDSNGYYCADTYDRLADSPVLIGDLTTAGTKVNDIDIDVYVYTTDTTLHAEQILSIAEDVLESAGEFIEYSPVPYYKFLMVLLDYETFTQLTSVGGGALEHSYSSLHFLAYSADRLPEIRSTMAHEFMHILTPLHLHSEIIHTYNFTTPTPSEHIWLYEGVTEWISDIMQLRSGLITTEEYLNELSLKLRINESFNPDISLSEMSLEVYNNEMIKQFYNFYCRGAVTAALLDIKLLELSDGRRGLRELLLELLNDYGKNKPFPEEKFFKVIVENTYPEIEQFINNYIRDSQPLPYKEYMYKIGFNYIEEKLSDDKRPVFGINVKLNENSELIVENEGKAQSFGLQRGDILVRVLGQEVSLQTFRNIADSAYTMNVGDEYNIVIKRDGKEIEMTGVLFQRISRHVFESIEEPTPEQKFLREKWLQNLVLE